MRWTLKSLICLHLFWHIIVRKNRDIWSTDKGCYTNRTKSKAHKKCLGWTWSSKIDIFEASHHSKYFWTTHEYTLRRSSIHFFFIDCTCISPIFTSCLKRISIHCNTIHNHRTVNSLSFINKYCFGSATLDSTKLSRELGIYIEQENFETTIWSCLESFLLISKFILIK